jgi:hypothetical protein
MQRAAVAQTVASGRNGVTCSLHRQTCCLHLHGRSVTWIRAVTNLGCHALCCQLFCRKSAIFIWSSWKVGCAIQLPSAPQPADTKYGTFDPPLFVPKPKEQLSVYRGWNLIMQSRTSATWSAPDSFGGYWQQVSPLTGSCNTDRTWRPRF